MASHVAWLAFDAEQQRRTNLMIAALASQGTVDELGLGVVRDLLAEALHPGLIVLHTRAKYLIFIPRDFRNLRGTSSAAAAAAHRGPRHNPQRLGLSHRLVCVIGGAE